MNLSQLIISFSSIVSEILLNSNKARFHIFSPDAIELLREKDKALGRYWDCIAVLEDCRLSSITGLMRSYKWLEGINVFYEKPNYMVFSASLRGLLLSAADNKYSLSRFPRLIVERKNQISESLLKSKEKSNIFTNFPFDDFREISEHFLRARDRRHNTIGNPNLTAKSDKDYITILQAGNTGNIGNLYSELCEITHPASASLFAYIHENLLDNSDESGTFLNIESDKDLIDDLVTKYSLDFKKIFESAFNPSLLTLGLLNLMNVEELRTPLNIKDLKFIGKWSNYSGEIKKVFGNNR